MAKDIGYWITLPDGEKLKTHSSEECSGPPCVIHSPSDHPLKDAPLRWRNDRAMMERICEHGIAHPDPDDRAHWERRLGGDPASREFIEARAQHACCGCCGQPNELQKLQEIVEQYGNAWVDGTREFGPFKHLPDGGELRIVDALEVVLRTMRFAQDRGFATVSIDLLTEAIGYSFSDAKWTDEAINYRNETP